MKNLSSVTKGNALIAVVTKGENLGFVVADAKHIAWVVAALAVNPETLCPTNDVRVVEAKPSVYKKISKISNNPAAVVEFPADAEEIKAVAELLADESNLFDIPEIIAAYTGSIRVFVAEKDGKFYVVKANTGIKSVVEKLLADNGYTIVTTGLVKDENVIRFAAMKRVAGKKAELVTYEVTPEIKDELVELLKPETPADETAAPAPETAEEPAPEAE